MWLGSALDSTIQNRKKMKQIETQHAEWEKQAEDEIEADIERDIERARERERERQA